MFSKHFKIFLKQNFALISEITFVFTDSGSKKVIRRIKNKKIQKFIRLIKMIILNNASKNNLKSLQWMSFPYSGTQNLSLFDAISHHVGLSLIVSTLPIYLNVKEVVYFWVKICSHWLQFINSLKGSISFDLNGNVTFNQKTLKTIKIYSRVVFFVAGRSSKNSVELVR